MVRRPPLPKISYVYEQAQKMISNERPCAIVGAKCMSANSKAPYVETIAGIDSGMLQKLVTAYLLLPVVCG